VTPVRGTAIADTGPQVGHPRAFSV